MMGDLQDSYLRLCPRIGRLSWLPAQGLGKNVILSHYWKVPWRNDWIENVEHSCPMNDALDACCLTVDLLQAEADYLSPSRFPKEPIHGAVDLTARSLSGI